MSTKTLADNEPDRNDVEPQAPRRLTDQRGIALQTVIIMVVLLAIAGGVAAVLLNRGSAASDQLQNQEVTVGATSYGNQALCDAAGHDWDEDIDTVTAGDQGQCEGKGGAAKFKQPKCEANGYTDKSGGSDCEDKD